MACLPVLDHGIFSSIMRDSKSYTTRVTLRNECAGFY
jgi:hypothetical protein